jgi:hypothetical protein
VDILHAGSWSPTHVQRLRQDQADRAPRARIVRKTRDATAGLTVTRLANHDGQPSRDTSSAMMLGGRPVLRPFFSIGSLNNFPTTAQPSPSSSICNRSALQALRIQSTVVIAVRRGNSVA